MKKVTLFLVLIFSASMPPGFAAEDRPYAGKANKN
jgi:hypothetical protein